MTRRSMGFGFCAIAAFLFASRYLCAAVFGSGVRSWSSGLFRAMYGYVGPGLSIAASVALVAGVGYIIWGELTDRRK